MIFGGVNPQRKILRTKLTSGWDSGFWGGINKPLGLPVRSPLVVPFQDLTALMGWEILCENKDHHCEVEEEGAARPLSGRWGNGGLYK